MIESLTPQEELSTLNRVKEEDKRISSNVGVLSDGLGNNPKALNNIDAMVLKQKENAYDYQGNNLSLETVDFISNLNFNGSLIQRMKNILLDPNLNTYESKTKSKLEMYAEVIADNYYLLGKTKVPKNELKAEVILERVAAQKADLDQFIGKLNLVNPEMAQFFKDKLDMKLFNHVIDSAKNVSVSDEKYTPTFKLNK